VKHLAKEETQFNILIESKFFKNLYLNDYCLYFPRKFIFKCSLNDFAATDVRNEFLEYITMFKYVDRKIGNHICMQEYIKLVAFQTKLREDFYQLIFHLINKETTSFVLKRESALAFWNENDNRSHLNAILCELSKKAPKLRVLKLVGFKSLQCPSLENIPAPFSNLQVLKLDDVVLSDFDLEKMVALIPNVEELEVV
jgi:hypothetical protein